MIHPVPIDRLPGGRYDAELGPMRICPKCGEEWPYDAEFFVIAKRRRDGAPVFGRLCRACSIEAFKSRVAPGCPCSSCTAWFASVQLGERGRV